MSDLRDLLYVAQDTTHVVSSCFCAFAPYGCRKDAKAWAGVLTDPDAHDSGVVHNDACLTRKKKVQFLGCTEIVVYDAHTPTGRVEHVSCEHENSLYTPSMGDIAGARDTEWLGWHLSENDYLLCKKAC